MEVSVEFERCIDFLVQMVELYGEDVLREAESIEKESDDSHAA